MSAALVAIIREAVSDAEHRGAIKALMAFVKIWDSMPPEERATKTASSVASMILVHLPSEPCNISEEAS